MTPYANNNRNPPFVPFPNAYETQNKWKPVVTHPSSENAGKQQELGKNILEQVASHTSMIEELRKSISSISADIRSLQHQSAGLDKALSKLADNQATLLSMSAGKPHASPMVGMNSIVVSEIPSSTLEETYNELLDYVDLLEPLLKSMNVEENNVKEKVVEEKEVEEVKNALR